MTEPAVAWERATEWPRAIAGMFERNLAGAVPSLASPTSPESARARRIVALFVETLGGYAYGTVAGQLAHGVTTWFGAAPGARVRAAVREAAPSVPPPPLGDIELASARVALVEEVDAALRIRFMLLAERLGELVERSLEALPPGVGQHAALTERLRSDLAHDDRLALEIMTGWSYACAVIERRPIAATGSPRARELWRTWARLAGHGEAPAQAEPAGDYIARIV